MSRQPSLVIPARDDVSEIATFHRGERLLSALAEIGVDVVGRRVVDLGAGFGSLSVAAAVAGAASVLAVDVNPDRLDVISGRASDRGVHVAVQRTNLLDGWHGPCDADLVFLFGVVEYAGLWDDVEPVRALQARLFRAAFDSLRDGGQLVFGSKNRLWPRFVVKDANTRQPLVNVLPRALADRLSRRMSGTPYRHHIHSPRGWTDLIDAAGFKQVQCYSPFLSYQLPVRIVARPSIHHVLHIRRSLSNLEERKLAWGRLGTAKAVLMVGGAALGVPLAHSVVAVATKEGAT